jgi:hypothetical protein
MSDESLPLPNSEASAVDDAAPTERAPSTGATPASARMRGMAMTLLWWRDDERESTPARTGAAHAD